MSEETGKRKLETGAKENQNLLGELWIVIPFFILSVTFFAGSFKYKLEAASVPMFIGLLTAILTGMRLIHVLFPKSGIGRFREKGLAGEFDQIKEEIEEQALKSSVEEESKEIIFPQELKAFIALLGCLLGFLLFGYFVGIFIVIIGTGYYYGYREKGPLLISIATMLIVIYGILYKLLDAPAYYGFLIGPLLEKFDLL